MPTTEDARAIEVAGVEVPVVRKAIKNLHVGVYPPAGSVCVVAQASVSLPPQRAPSPSR